MLDNERRRELERHMMLRGIKDPLSREEMKLRFIMERDNAAKSVKKLSKRQREELDSLFSH